MKRRFLKILVFFLVGLPLAFSQGVQVNGTVYFGDAGDVIPEYPVYLTSNDSTFYMETLTDDNGVYEFFAPIPDGSLNVFVSTFDICTGELLEVDLSEIINPNDFEATVDFYICGDIFPPDNTGCDAYFFNEQTGIDPYTVEFHDASYAIPEAHTFEWSFGDGAASSDQNPIHDYASPGTYEVTLAITSDSCTSSATYWIDVTEELNCICPEYYDPVCAIGPNGDTLTFSNICFAECEGFTIDNIFSCEPDGCICPDVFDPVCVALFPNGPVVTYPNECYALCDGYSPNDFVTCDSTGCNCPDFYDPVCVATSTGDTLTFDNYCFAECEGYTWDQIVECNDNCICPDIWDPVCVATPSGGLLTFANACEAECEGFGPDVYFSCDSTGCNCPLIYDPVCVATPSGDTLTFDNYCLAECEGYTWDQIVECDDNCICPDVWNPVCVATPSGGLLTFANACEAECEGFGPDVYFSCDSTGCNCPEFYDPVCVINADGDIITFDNFCFAECEGYTWNDFVECDDECNCYQIWDPVCVMDPAGNIISFPNDCYAECEGYTPDMFVPCDTSDCNCPFIYDPVCVSTANGEMIEFPNFCFAECEGYTEDNLVDCNYNENDCQALFFIDYEANPSGSGLSVQFIDESWAESDIISWSWDFGDDNYSYEQSPVHTYQEEGVYDVTLEIMTADSSCYSSYTEHICVFNDGWVEGPDCQAMFWFENDGNTSTTTFQFFDESLGDLESWYWDFGDGNTSTEQNPTHTYADEGVYEVTLTVSGQENCVNSATMLLFANDDVWYPEECVALFYPLEIPSDIDTLDFGENTFVFLNLSFSSVTHEWDFGDGNTSAEFIPVHTYTEAGEYLVTLTITTESGCTATFAAPVYVGGVNANNDFSGTPGYANATSTEEPEVLSKMKISPNPSIGNSTLHFTMNKAGDYQVQILDIAGKQIESINGNGQTGSNLLPLDMNNYQNGMYFIRVQSQGQSSSLKLIKQ